MENFLTVEQCKEMSDSLYNIMHAIQMQQHALEGIDELIRSNKDFEAKKIMLQFIDTAHYQDQDISTRLDHICFKLANADDEKELQA